MSQELTDKQRDTLEFIIEYHLENNKPPSYREIAREFDLASTRSAYDRVLALKKKGHISTGTTAKDIYTGRAQKVEGE